MTGLTSAVSWSSAIGFVAGSVLTFALTLVSESQEVDYTFLLEEQAGAFELLAKGIAQQYAQAEDKQLPEGSAFNIRSARVRLAIYGSEEQLKAVSRYYLVRHDLAKGPFAENCIGDRKEFLGIDCKSARGFEMGECGPQQGIEEDVAMYQQLRQELLRVSWIDRLLGRDPRFGEDQKEDEQRVLALVVHGCLLVK